MCRFCGLRPCAPPLPPLPPQCATTSAPQVLIFRDGEAMDFVGDPAEKASIVEVMLREVS